MPTQRRIRFYPHSLGSDTVMSLSRALRDMGDNSLVLRREGSRYRYNEDDLIVNWGATDIPFDNVVNKRDSVRSSVDKMQALTGISLYGAPTPDYTSSTHTAESWLEEGDRVMCRTQLRSRSGGGIVVASTLDELVEAPLYTRYFPHREEYRVHVQLTVDGLPPRIQRKGIREGTGDEVDWSVRTHSNGFIYLGCELDDVPGAVLRYAARAVYALGLDFGAVDVAYRPQDDDARVLEVNTAPGLVGSTLAHYANLFHSMANNEERR